MNHTRYMRSWSPGYLEWRAEVEERRKQLRIIEIQAAHEKVIWRSAEPRPVEVSAFYPPREVTNMSGDKRWACTGCGLSYGTERGAAKCCRKIEG